MNKYYILMKVKSWDTLAIKFLNKEYITQPDTTSIGFCLIYKTIEDCIADGEDPEHLIEVEEDY
jgi:hypothetical protein